MILSKFRSRWFAPIVVAGFLVGCSAPTPTPVPPPPPMQPNTPLPPPARPNTPLPPPTAEGTARSSDQATACSESETSPLGILRSTDHGATWTTLGNACMPDATNVAAVDPTPVMINGRITLYFVDFFHLDRGILYRSGSDDGINFDQPQAVFTHSNGGLVDPFVLQLSDGSFRVYVTGEESIISASSSDGLTFTQDQGFRSKIGGMAGALLLTDNRIRLFLSSDGISSLISSDGIHFTEEEGLRIPAIPNSVVDNPEPIRLSDGSYLMVFSIHDRKYEGQLPWKHTEIRLAASTDGYQWAVNPKIFGYGGTSCVVEAQDGTLFIYYVDR